MTLGEKIVYLRKKNGFTQQELADRLHTSKQAICKYERGIVDNIPLTKVEELAAILNCTPGYLMGWDEEEEKPTPKQDELLDLSDAEKQLIEMMRTMTEADQQRLLRIVQAALPDKQ